MPRLAAILVLLLVAPSAAAKTPFRSRTHFSPGRVGVTTDNKLRVFIDGGSLQGAAFGKRALRAAGAETVQLAAGAHRLMRGEPHTYERVLITPSHVALVHRSGVVDLVRRQDARTQVSAGKARSSERFRVGVGACGFPIMAERGPADTVLLYRQLPARSRGQVASTDVNTSFALGQEDAYHPFGRAGRTVRVAVPGRIFNDAVEGRAGAVGWNNLGDGYSTGLEVLKEVQLPSARVRQLFDFAPTP